MATKRKADVVAEGRAFFKRVASDGAYAPVFAVHGEERYLVDEAVARLVRTVFPEGRDDFNLDVFHGGDAKGLDIASACDQLPMFAARRVVVVRAGEQLKAGDWEPIAAYTQRPSPSTLLILEATKFDRRSKAAKTALGAADVEQVEFPLLGERDARPWVARRASSRGLQLANDVAAYLVDALGPSLQQLDLALERIDLYVGPSTDGAPRRVTVGVASDVVPDTRVRSVFELADHLAARNVGASVGCFHRMLEQGDSPIGALSMIARQFRQLLLMHDGQRLGLSERELARHVGCPPFRLRDTAAAARRFTPGRLQRILGEILETDRLLKSSRLPDALHVERLLVAICA